MSRFFNIAGPNRPEWHYTLPVLERLPEVQGLVAERAWFVLHAPRQSGKTTGMRALAAELTASGRYAAAYATCEAGEPFPDDPVQATWAVVERLAHSAHLHLPEPLRPRRPSHTEAHATFLAAWLGEWCQLCPLPVVLLLDEIDALQDAALISVLRQLRAIYPEIPNAAPSTVALIGLRDVRDYKVKSGDAPHLGTASPFNVKARSLTLSTFTRTEVAALYGQHTADTGQRFTEEAIDHAWALTEGQPWLVNALAREVVTTLGVTGVIEAHHFEVAKERLVLARSTHLDSLADKLDEPRVRRVIGPLLASGELSPQVPLDDLEYCRDLGLVVLDRGAVRVANPIYREVLPRQLAYDLGLRMGGIEDRRWARPDGRLDLAALLAEFVRFWKRNGEWMIQRHQWPEAAHQLLLMAFLQRVVNGGGIIQREYGLGRGRVDLFIRWALQTDRHGVMLSEDTHALELKVWRDNARGDVLAEGLAQLDGYLDRLGARRTQAQPQDPSGTLVLFDARTGSPTGADWDHRGVLSEVQSPHGRTVGLLML